MTRKKKILIIVCSLLVLGSAATAYLSATSFSRQFNPSLQLTIETIAAPAALQNNGPALSQPLHAQQKPAPQAGAKASTETASGPALALAIHPQLVAAQAPAQKKASLPEQKTTSCGYSGTLVILFLGTDERDEIPYGADIIRFVKIDFDNPAITCVSLSRDLWVKTPALEDRRIEEKRLGEVFDVVQTSTPGTFQEQYLAATTVLTQTLVDNFGIAPDRYLTVPQSSFATLVDALGGIQVEVPQDQAAYKRVLITGNQTLNGQQSLAYIRLFEGYGMGDFGRNMRQLPFIKAVLSKMVEPANIVKMPGIVSRLQERMVSDLSPALIASLTCIMSKVPHEKVNYYVVPKDMTSPGPENALRPDAPKVTAWLQGLLK